MAENNSHAPNILNTSSNLLGLCFIVLTSLQVLDLKQKTIIDELTSIAIILFMTSSILSFLSMRSKTKRKDIYERIADLVFLSGLIFLFLTTMLIALKVIH